MSDFLLQIGASGGQTFFAVLAGIICFTMGIVIIPKALNRITPHLNEEFEIAKGNQAMAEYFGRVVAASIIGLSLIIAAGILVGFH